MGITCATMGAVKAAVCPLMQALTRADMSCLEWAGHGYFPDDAAMGISGGIDTNAANAALAAMAGAEAAILVDSCAAVAAMDVVTASGVTCRNHELGHACALLDELMG